MLLFYIYYYDLKILYLCSRHTHNVYKYVKTTTIYHLHLNKYIQQVHVKNVLIHVDATKLDIELTL